MTAEKKRGLGRGLDALFRQAESEEEAFAPKIKRADEMVAAAQQMQQAQQAPATAAAAPVEVKSRPETPAAQQPSGPRKVAVEKLVPGKFQPRRKFTDEAIDQLAESIAVHGILQPLLVRELPGGRFEIIAGERRWRAAQRAQLHELPVVVRAMSDKEALEIGLIENLQREDLTPLEEAEGYQRLMDEFFHTQDTLAKQLGKSRSNIANALRLLKLSPALKRLIQLGELSAGHARALVGVEGAEDIATAVLKRGLSVRETENLVRKAVEGKQGGPKNLGKDSTGAAYVQKDVDVLALEEKMTSLLGLKVTIDGKGASGRLVIEYGTLAQLDDVLERLSRAPGK